jgi:serine/threonine-protein kinase
MSKIGNFEIQSELAKSPTGGIYKVNDPQSGQTVALKTIELSAFGESAADLERALLEEAESTKNLSSPNITPVYGAGEIEGQFCATMEYVQGNSIATMLARKEGFSIWDLLDIGRQVCAGLEQAHAEKVYHYSLEPAKIMCGWDGTVKILGFGVSSAGKFVQHMPAGVPSILHYMSPEQIRGEAIDARSNIFSLGAMFYEMVADRKAFDREDAASLAQSVVESMPVPPMHVNPKVHPLLSDLIMKALAKDPAERYQRGRDLLEDLEKCKESKQAGKKPAEPAKSAAAPEKPKAPVQAKPVAPPVVQASAPETKIAAPKPVERKQPAPAPAPKVTLARPNVQATPAPKAAAAAAGWGGGAKTSPAPDVEASSLPSAYMSSAVMDEPAVETFAPDGPKIAVDPMMAEGASRGSSTSFSDIAELPPLKEVYIAPPTPPQAPLPMDAPAVTMFHGEVEEEEKPKIQPREVAQKALKEIKGVPPKLILYSIAGAVVLIVIIAIALLMHIHSLSGDDDSGAASSASTANDNAAQPAASEAGPKQHATPARSAAPAAESDGSAPTVTHPAVGAAGKGKNSKKPVAAPVAVVVPGQIAVDSTPQGAQVQVDGKSDSAWVTPFTLANLQPGQHSITVSKAGYTSDTRSVDVASGNKAAIVIHLAQLMATLSVISDPAGASVFVDGRDTGKTTPAQISVDKGQHVVLVRKLGYIDETTTAQFALGQTFSISPTLRPMGNTDNLRTVGKMKKLFGGNVGQGGQATVSIRTQPKGAQVAINQHMLEKGSPIDVMLDPGNYVVDINLSGYAPVHKVITADKGGKVVVDEVLQKQ